VAGELGALVSVDTYKPAVADAAIAAGAAIVNDVSGLRDPELATVCARTGAALVLMHTRVAPKQKLENPVYDDVAGDVEAFLRDLMGKAVERGVAEEQLLLDPGPDFAKTPAQTVAALQGMDRLHALGRPLLLALSRKDFVGAITGRPPGERLAGTLAAVGWGWRAGGHVFRVHDVAAAREALSVQRVLDGEVALDAGVRLAEELRRQGPDD
jgi:dihydropteroate synthase